MSEESSFSYWFVLVKMDFLTGFSWALTGVLDFSLSGDLSFLLICLTGNLWFSFTGFNKIKDLHLPDLLVLMWGCFSGLVSILDVFSEVRRSLFISLLLRSSNLEIFCNIGYANFKASCFLFKDALSLFLISCTSVFPSFCYWTACLLPVYFLEWALYVMSDFALPLESRLLNLFSRVIFGFLSLLPWCWFFYSVFSYVSVISPIWCQRGLGTTMK